MSEPAASFQRRLDHPLHCVARALQIVGPVGTEIETQANLELGRFRRPVPVRLLVFALPGTGVTLVELVPDHPVTVDERYFRAGHRFLDDLTAMIDATVIRTPDELKAAS